MREVNFTVDSALLHELGSRLVGRPHIALAELIKNSYDADARKVRIIFDGDLIVIEDDGHGMTPERFESFWMRVGTTNKASLARSPELERALTGSKGVGRLASQLLAKNIKIESVGLEDTTLGGYRKRKSAAGRSIGPKLTAEVDWERAVQQGDLTAVKVPVSETASDTTFVDGSNIGTRITLSGLRDEWSEEEFVDLAREIWALQPPFELDMDETASFSIQLESKFGAVVEEFREQMAAVFEGWQGQIRLRLIDDNPNADVLFEFDASKDYDDESDDRGRERSALSNARLLEVDLTVGRKSSKHIRQLVRVKNCPLQKADAQISIFNLQRRQPRGVLVSDARAWMNDFGGVHIYDDGFRLPYYGPQDWLNIERDHARRLSRSQLVPESLRVSKALQDLPSRRRVFGAVNVSTASERREATKAGVSDSQILSIQVSRDRLSDNAALRALSNIVRLGFDLYSTEYARSKALSSAKSRQTSAPPPKPSSDLRVVREALEAAKSSIPAAQFVSIVDNLDQAEQRVTTLERSRETESALLGALATVGMTTLAWEHESAKQRLVVLNAARELETNPSADLAYQAAVLKESAHRLEDIARVFRPVLDREARETITALRARRFIERTARQIAVLGRGAEISTEGIARDLELPPGTYAGWSAIFQNLLINAFNAVLENRDKLIQIDSAKEGGRSVVRIQDAGIGVDLEDAERLFLPFERGIEEDPRRSSMGLGGTGLGLTIVRMIGDTMGVTIRFVKPEKRFSTAIAIEWESDR